MSATRNLPDNNDKNHGLEVLSYAAFLDEERTARAARASAPGLFARPAQSNALYHLGNSLGSKLRHYISSLANISPGFYTYQAEICITTPKTADTLTIR